MSVCMRVRIYAVKVFVGLCRCADVCICRGMQASAYVCMSMTAYMHRRTCTCMHIWGV